MYSRRSLLVRTSNGKHVLEIPCLEQILETTAKSERNESLLALCYASWLELLSDSPLSLTKGPKPWKVWRKFSNELFQTPAMVTLKKYSRLCDRLLEGLTLYGAGSDVGPYIRDFVDTPIYSEYFEFRRTGDPELLSFIVSFLIFAKKLRIEDEEFYTVALSEWLGVEKKLSSLVIPDDDITALLRVIVGALLRNFKLSPLRPKFGPGKVAEPGLRNVDDKFHNLYRHSMIDELLLASGLDISEVDGYLRFINCDGTTEGVKRSRYKGTHLARLKFVPKDISKARSICMEPNILMYVQQSVFRDFVDCFRGGAIRRYVDLSDQRPNQMAAYYGSFTGDVDTIDMSAASDSVSWDLITAIFPDSVVSILSLLRSEYAELPDRRKVKLKKFAPMGSALCFPIQNIVFLAFSILSGILHICQARGISPEAYKLGLMSHRNPEEVLDTLFYDSYGFIHPSAKLLQPPRIFGDDICVDSSTTGTLITLLTRYGFSVNESKSFMGSQAVRESCGKYYYRGHDITPLRFSLGFRTSLTDAKAVSSQVDFTNRSFGYGYANLWRFHVRELLWSGGDKKFPLQFSDREDLPFRIYHPKPVNSHLRSSAWSNPSAALSRKTVQPKKSHSHDYQRHEEFCFVDVAKDPQVSLSSEASDGYRYMRWWMERTDRIVDVVLPTYGSVYAAGDRIRLGWTPA